MADITIDVNPQQSTINATPQLRQTSIDVEVVEHPINWGTITGTLSNQTDLQTALNSKQNNLTAGNLISLANNTVSFTGTIPTKTSDITNDSGFINKDVNNLTYYTKTSDLPMLQQALEQHTTIPTAQASNVGKIIEYTGQDITNFANGYIYKCISVVDTEAVAESLTITQTDNVLTMGSFTTNLNTFKTAMNPVGTFTYTFSCVGKPNQIELSKFENGFQFLTLTRDSVFDNAQFHVFGWLDGSNNYYFTNTDVPTSDTIFYVGSTDEFGTPTSTNSGWEYISTTTRLSTGRGMWRIGGSEEQIALSDYGIYNASEGVIGNTLSVAYVAPVAEVVHYEWQRINVQPSYRPDLFDHKWADHQLNDIQWLRGDTFSWQDGTVYSAAYNELLSEYNNASSTTERDYSSPRYTVIGSPAISNDILSNISTSNYLKINGNGIIANPTSFEIVIDVTTPVTMTSNGRIFNPTNGADSTTAPFIEVNSTQATLNFYNGSTTIFCKAMNNPSASTHYRFKWIYNSTANTIEGSYSTNNGASYTVTETITPSFAPYFNSTEFSVGCRSFDSSAVCVWNGTINLKESYFKVNNSMWLELYNGLVTYKRTPKGYKIASAEEESDILSLYNTTGVAWYYIIDTTNHRFKLPRTKHNKYTTSLAVKGNGTSLGLTDGSNKFFGLNSNTTPSSPIATNNTYNKTLPYTNSDGTMSVSVGNTWGITTDSTKSGIITDNIPQDTDQYKYLYFYVGNYTQPAIEQTAGLNAELFNGKADINLNNVANNIDYVVESYSNGTSWYRVYKSGWVEQGNFLTGVTGTQTITLLKPYNSTNYTITTAFSYTSTINAVRTINNNNKTSSSFQIFKGDDSVVGVYWKAEGQGA